VLARLDGYRSVNAEAALRATALQTALGTISAQSESSANALLSASTSGNRGQIDTAGRQAHDDLRSTMAILNGRFADRALFSGTETTTAPLPDADGFLANIQASFGPIATAADLVTAVDAWFAAPTGFAATYQGGAGTAPMDIAPGETADLDVRANDPVLRSTLRGQVLAALLDTSLFATNQPERAALAQTAAEALLTSATDRTTLAARIGVAEEKIDGAVTRNAAERSALDIARTSLLAADPYEAATRLEAAETQLKSIYSVTARLSRLSLVDYL
jgi:flagellar hook-associated protein 3 FlgL